MHISYFTTVEMQLHLIIHFIINIVVKYKVQSDFPVHHVILSFFQARNIRSSEMAAIKIVKLDPGV